MKVERSFAMDNFTLVVQRVDRDYVFLSFLQNGERLNSVPNGYKFYLLSDIGDKLMEQASLCGAFTLYWGRSYVLEKDGVVKVSFLHSTKHEIIVA